MPDIPVNKIFGSLTLVTADSHFIDSVGRLITVTLTPGITYGLNAQFMLHTFESMIGGKCEHNLFGGVYSTPFHCTLAEQFKSKVNGFPVTRFDNSPWFEFGSVAKKWDTAYSLCSRCLQVQPGKITYDPDCFRKVSHMKFYAFQICSELATLYGCLNGLISFDNDHDYNIHALRYIK